MSDYHILDKALDGKTVNCVFHIAIPGPEDNNPDNSVGTPWRAAIVDHFSPVPVLPRNDTENALIEAGAVWEVSKTVRFSTTDLTSAQKLAEVEAFYTAENTTALQKLSDMLDFYGKKGDV